MSGTGERPTPRQATALIGHEGAERTFLDAWASGRMHHAWLLAGPRGIGKATLAYRIARFVLSRDDDNGVGFFGDQPLPAGDLMVPADHPVARQVAAGGHPNLLTIERSINPQTGKRRGEIVVEDVRRLSAFLGLTTGAGSWRVAVVDVADEMNRNAANALLKGLEEPPQHTLFLLISHCPGRLLPTIRSRCHMLRLSPLSEELVVALLAEFEPGLADDDAGAVARLADGSIGQALTLVDTGGLVLYRELVKLLVARDEPDVTALHALAGRVGRSGAEESFDMLAQLLDRWISGIILGRARGAMTPEVIAGEAAGTRPVVSRGSLANWLEVWEKVSRLFSRARSANLDRTQVVVNAFLALRTMTRG